jgi:hypothetical protein
METPIDRLQRGEEEQVEIDNQVNLLYCPDLTSSSLFMHHYLATVDILFVPATDVVS